MTLDRTLRLPAALVSLAGGLALLATGPALLAAGGQDLDGDATRGRLLYENHCQGCHTSSAHVRANRKAHSFEDVRRWVQRWQGAETLDWSRTDVRDVATWLYLRFYDPGRPPPTGHGSG